MAEHKPIFRVIVRARDSGGYMLFLAVLFGVSHHGVFSVLSSVKSRGPWRCEHGVPPSRDVRRRCAWRLRRGGGARQSGSSAGEWGREEPARGKRDRTQMVPIVATLLRRLLPGYPWRLEVGRRSG
jgi:hypothetical protein